MTTIGLLLVTLAGVGTGTLAWPIKLMRRFQFEQFWFVGMLVGMLIAPWLITLTSIPNALSVYAALDPALLAKSNAFAFSWGIANVLYAISVVRIGAALTGAILTGLGIAIGVVVPMVFKASGLFAEAPSWNSSAGALVLAGVVVVLVGVAVVTIAGFGREKVMNKENKTSGGFMGGLLMSVIGGILSCGLSFAFVYSQGPIVEAMERQGGSTTSANLAVWAVGLLGGVLVNVLYPAYLMTKKKSWHLLVDCPRDLILAAILGVQFIVSVVLMGRGMVFLGVLGASVGFGIQQVMQILGNQGVGFASGEWSGVSGTPLRQMYLAIVILILAVIIMASGNMLIDRRTENSAHGLGPPSTQREGSWRLRELEGSFQLAS